MSEPLFVLRKSAVSLHTKNLGWKFPVRKKGVIDHFSFVRRKTFLAPPAVKLKFHLIPFRLCQKRKWKMNAEKRMWTCRSAKMTTAALFFLQSSWGRSRIPFFETPSLWSICLQPFQEPIPVYSLPAHIWKFPKRHSARSVSNIAASRNSGEPHLDL